MSFRGSVFECQLNNSNKHLWNSWWIRVNDNCNCETSEHNEQWNRGPFWLRRHTEALQRRSRFTMVLVFIPPKNHDYSFEFHPIKTALRPQGTAPVLRVVPFQDLWWHVWRSSHQMKHRAITLAPQKKEITTILLICSRYDERRKAEHWIRCHRSCSIPGTNPNTVYNMFKNLDMSLALLSCWCISACSNRSK